MNLNPRRGWPASTQTASYFGPEYLWRRTKAAILNSRQSKFPVGDDPWIKATVKAVEFVAAHEYIFLTSISMNTWELSLVLVSEQKTPVIIVVPGSKADNQSVIDDITRRFRLDPALAGFVFADGEGGRRRKSVWPARDAIIAWEADILLPVSVRPGGNLDRILTDHPGKIHDTFTIPHQTSSRPRPKYDSFSINPTISEKEWLIHFTRSAPGPWPDETEYDYYHAVCRSGGDYCRSASATLDHILSIGIIYGSTRNIRHGDPVVGFTCFSAEKCRNLFRYRPRLVNPYFEPYGIAVRREAAVDLGIRAVQYGSPDLYADMAPSEKPYFQNIGSDGARWAGEYEWRFAGDFHLSRIPVDAGRVIVPFSSDIGRINAQTDLAFRPLFAEDTPF